MDQELAEVKESTLWSGRSSPDDEASQVQAKPDLRSWVAPCTNAVLRLIGKWLQAGVLENGRHHRPASGTPQG